MNKSKALVAMIVLLLLANAVWVFLYLGKNKTPRHEGRKMFSREQFKKEVGLTNEQVEQLERVNNEKQKQMLPLLDSMAKLRGRLYDSVLVTTDSTISVFLAQIAKLQTAIDWQIIASLHVARKICTAEQLPKFDSIMKRRMMYSGGRRRGPLTPDKK